MSRLAAMLKKEPFSLLVVLPQISTEFAKTAEGAGADAICVRFDSSKDKSDLIDIVRSVKVPVGILFSGEDDISKEQISAFVRLGFDFFELPMDMISSVPASGKSGRIASVDPDFNLEDLTRVAEKDISALDAAIIEQDLYGQDLTVGDLQEYITVCITSGVPVIVPTQKTVRVSEIPLIWDAGAKALLLDETITGDSISSFKSIVSEFKKSVISVKEECE